MHFGFFLNGIRRMDEHHDDNIEITRDVNDEEVIDQPDHRDDSDSDADTLDRHQSVSLQRCI